MEKQSLPFGLAHAIVKGVDQPVSKILEKAASILFVGCSSSEAGRVERVFDEVRGLVRAEQSLDNPRRRILKDGSAVVLVLPADWPAVPGSHLNNAAAFVSQLTGYAALAGAKLSMKLEVFVFQVTNTASLPTTAQDRRAALLRHFARFPFQPMHDSKVDFDNYAGHFNHQKDRPAQIEDFRNATAGIKIDGRFLIARTIAAAGGATAAMKCWAGTDIDYGLLRALAKAHVPPGQTAHHEDPLNVFLVNSDVQASVAQYCLMNKVAPVAPDVGKTTHLRITANQIRDLMAPPSPLIKSKMLWSSLQKRDKTLADSSKLTFRTVRDFVVDKVFAKAGAFLPEHALRTADDMACGLIWGGASPLKSANVDGIIYLDLNQYTSKVLQHISQQFSGDASAKNNPYRRILFALCRPGTIRASTAGFGYAAVDNIGDALQLCHLAGADGFTQGGAGQTAEFAAAVVAGCSDARLLCWPLPDHAEQTSNAQFMSCAFPSNVTQVNDKTFATALDSLVLARAKGAHTDANSDPFDAFSKAVLNPRSIADRTADILLSEAQDTDSVLEAVLAESKNQSLLRDYRLLKVCVQILDQLQGPDRTSKPADSTYAYPAPTSTVKLTAAWSSALAGRMHFRDEADAIDFLESGERLMAWLGLSNTVPSWNATNISQNAPFLVQETVRALRHQCESLEDLKKFAAHVALDAVMSHAKSGG